LNDETPEHEQGNMFMARIRTQDLNGSKETSKSKISLNCDLPIIKDLVIVMAETGWSQVADKFTLIFEKEEARLFYSRRSNSLQLYWVGYGHQQIQAPLDQFNGVEDIILWMDLLYQIELQTPAPDPEDEPYVLADLDPSDIINRIFE
jgi:hypothetical protein